MKANRLIAIALGAVVALFSILLALLTIMYMSEYPSRWMVAGFIFLSGAGIGVAAYRQISRVPDRRRTRIILLSIAAALAIIPIGSMYLSGEVTYARFGFTVYGLIPIPVMDITVASNGMLWFRDKTHWVSVEEVQSHIASGKGEQMIIIGTGWDNAVRIDPKINDLPNVDIRALPTPEAFNLFNRLKSEGIQVILIAHTTC